MQLAEKVHHRLCFFAMAKMHACLDLMVDLEEVEQVNSIWKHMCIQRMDLNCVGFDEGALRCVGGAGFRWSPPLVRRFLSPPNVTLSSQKREDGGAN
ncbi:hypothetical protein VNO78_31176 [Psophocarpus tetragonolobus]|uniref:Uncharacterized protein n=1 Tax=Psophocarpus tetragonolobus TaxID=3891 RepID=A0AAN9X747_PSOTE